MVTGLWSRSNLVLLRTNFFLHGISVPRDWIYPTTLTPTCSGFHCNLTTTKERKLMKHRLQNNKLKKCTKENRF